MSDTAVSPLAAPSGATPIAGLPYPIPDDGVDVPRDIKALADALDSKLGGGQALFATTIGDGAKTVIDVAHGLHTMNVHPVLRWIATGEFVATEAFTLDGDTIRLVFQSAPPNNSISLLLFGGSIPTPPIGVFSASVGDGGSSGPFVVNHGLGTRDFIVQAVQAVSPWDSVDVEDDRPDVNTVRIWTPGVVPVLNGLRILCLSRAGLQGAAAQHGINHIPGGNDYVPIPTVTSLPSNPVDGQECYFVADATNGVVWHLKYRAASSSIYKWEYVGGGVISVERGSANTTGTGGAYSNQLGDGTAACSVIAPLAGDYWMEHEASGSHAVDTTSINVGISTIVVSDFTNPGSNAGQGPTSGNHSNGGGTMGAMRASGVVNAPAAGRGICQTYLYTSKQPTSYHYRRVAVRPVRVG